MNSLKPIEKEPKLGIYLCELTKKQRYDGIQLILKMRCDEEKKPKPGHFIKMDMDIIKINNRRQTSFESLICGLRDQWQEFDVRSQTRIQFNRIYFKY